MTDRVVDGLQADDVDIGNGEPLRRPARTIDLVVKVQESRRACARPGQRVGLGDRQLLKQRFAVKPRLQPVASSLLAVPGRLLAVCRGASSNLSRRDAVSSGAPALLRRALQDLRGSAGSVAGVARRQFAIAQHCGLVTRRRCQVASVRDCVTSSGGFDTPRGDLMALLGAAVAKLTREVARARIAALVCRLAIAGGLVVVGGALVAIGGGLVAIGGALVALRLRLVDIREGLIAIGDRPIVLERPRGRNDALLLCPARPVHGIDVTIAWR